MQTITVNINWDDNNRAYSEEGSGCALTHETLEGVKHACFEAIELHLIDSVV